MQRAFGAAGKELEKAKKSVEKAAKGIAFYDARKSKKAIAAAAAALKADERRLLERAAKAR